MKLVSVKRKRFSSNGIWVNYIDLYLFGFIYIKTLHWYTTPKMPRERE